MAVKEILKMGDPLLQRVAEAVTEFNTPALDALVSDMFETMSASDGAGLAAPQIGVNLRVVIFAVGENPRYPEVETVPSTVLINPQIRTLDDSMEEGWEGCLSIPGLRGQVPRYQAIQYRGHDQAGELIERVARDFHARVVQHEVDHLDGILYPQRIRDLRNFGFESALFPEPKK
ncbi:Peptide deformylase [hydrothermal vent metagenome]|uniref:Peptide deformylase n=1 Tax=hydrothermal vent metagenome TaxID=652676 RepID=A0A3B1AS21_9ZZZZ